MCASRLFERVTKECGPYHAAAADSGSSCENPAAKAAELTTDEAAPDRNA
jgi:hypothetical protein